MSCLNSTPSDLTRSMTPSTPRAALTGLSDAARRPCALRPVGFAARTSSSALEAVQPSASASAASQPWATPAGGATTTTKAVPTLSRAATTPAHTLRPARQHRATRSRGGPPEGSNRLAGGLRPAGRCNGDKDRQQALRGVRSFLPLRHDDRGRKALGEPIQPVERAQLGPKRPAPRRRCGALSHSVKGRNSFCPSRSNRSARPRSRPSASR